MSIAFAPFLALALTTLTTATASAAVAPQRGPVAADPDFALEVRRLVEATNLKKAKIAVSIRDDAGRSIVAIAGDEPMIPASNMKLITTGVALRTLGPDFSFRTRLLLDGDRLIVVGDGDPAFGDPEMLHALTVVDDDGRERQGLSVDQLLGLWVDAVVASGPKRVQELVIDDRIFDREFVHESWPRDQLNEPYCAEVAGLNFHANRLDLYPKPVAGAKPAIARTQPSAPFLEIRNRATSKSGKNDGNTLWISRSPGRNDFTLNGNMKQASESPIPAVVHDMPSLFGEILADRLRGAGVHVERVRVAESSDPAPTGTPIGPVFRTPLATAIERANTDSENLYAEALLKRSAAHAAKAGGSWARGATLVMNVLSKAIGDQAAPFRVSDGSGLSRGNRVTASGLSAWVHALANDPAIGDAFLESLAVGGKSGTVRRRFRELDPEKIVVRCKTGYVNGVSTLSGVVETGGERWTFSVLGNDLTEASAVAKVKQLQEQVVRAVNRKMTALASASEPDKRSATGAAPPSPPRGG